MMLRHRRLSLIALLMVCGAAVVSCDERMPEYSLGFYNDTTKEMTEVRADWQADGIARHEEAGILAADAEASIGEEPRPIPKSATITWRSADGKPHTKTVDVEKLIANPSEFSGTIYFKLTPDGRVTVVPLTYAEEREAAINGKSALRGH